MPSSFRLLGLVRRATRSAPLSLDHRSDVNLLLLLFGAVRCLVPVSGRFRSLPFLHLILLLWLRLLRQLDDGANERVSEGEQREEGNRQDHSLTPGEVENTQRHNKCCVEDGVKLGRKVAVGGLIAEVRGNMMI